MRIELSLALLLTAAGASAETLTAVYTLDAVKVRLFPDSETSLKAQITEYASRCDIVEGGALFVLSCPAEPAREGPGEREGVEAAVALFRDLNETVYVASCPLFEEEERRHRRGNRAEREAEIELDPEEEAQRRDCLEIGPGLTFSAETDDKLIKIVFRGRQLPLQLDRVRPRPTRLGSPYTPDPSDAALPRRGPPTVSVVEPPNPPDPDWSPPDPGQRALREPRKPRAALKDPPPAETSLPTGTLEVRCTTSGLDVYVDGAYLGPCPMKMPLRAGRHRVEARGASGVTAREIKLAAGEQLRLRFDR